MDIETPKLRGGYVGWKLPEEERAMLLEIVPPLFQDVIAHHITLRIGVREDFALPTATQAMVVGVVHDDRVQALVVEIDGTTERGDGTRYHITWSIDRSLGAKPADSKKLVSAGFDRLPGPMQNIPIRIIPTFFPQATPEPKEITFSETQEFRNILETIKPR